MIREYHEVKSAIERATSEGWTVKIKYGTVELSKAKKVVEPLCTAREIHVYLNGYSDGALSSKLF